MVGVALAKFYFDSIHAPYFLAFFLTLFLLLLLLLEVLLFFSLLADPFLVTLDAGPHRLPVADLRVVAVKDGPEGRQGGDTHDNCRATPR